MTHNNLKDAVSECIAKWALMYLETNGKFKFDMIFLDYDEVANKVVDYDGYLMSSKKDSNHWEFIVTYERFQDIFINVVFNPENELYTITLYKKGQLIDGVTVSVDI